MRIASPSLPTSRLEAILPLATSAVADFCALFTVLYTTTALLCNRARFLVPNLTPPLPLSHNWPSAPRFDLTTAFHHRLFGLPRFGHDDVLLLSLATVAAADAVNGSRDDDPKTTAAPTPNTLQGSSAAAPACLAIFEKEPRGGRRGAPQGGGRSSVRVRTVYPLYLPYLSTLRKN